MGDQGQAHAAGANGGLSAPVDSMESELKNPRCVLVFCWGCCGCACLMCVRMLMRTSVCPRVARRFLYVRAGVNVGVGG